eukprot:690507-Rhodomonas_salina.1
MNGGTTASMNGTDADNNGGRNLAPAAPALAAPAPAQSMMPQQAPRAPPPPAHKVEPLVTKVRSAPTL